MLLFLTMGATMVKKLVKKAEFSRLCGTSATATTKACKGVLLPAMVGTRIDIDHLAAKEYINKHAATPTPEPATGIDPLYEQALKHCQDSGNFSASSIQKNMNIGYARAKRIYALIEAVGGKTVKPAPPPPPPPVKPAPPPPPPPATGHVAANNKKKATSLANLNERIENDTKIHQIPDDIKAFVDMTLWELIQRFGTETAFRDWLTATKQIEDINSKRIVNAEKKGQLISKQLVQGSVIDVFNAAHLKLMKDGAKTIAAGVISKHLSGAANIEIENYISDILGSFIKPVKDKIKRSLKNA